MRNFVFLGLIMLATNSFASSKLKDYSRNPANKNVCEYKLSGWSHMKTALTQLSTVNKKEYSQIKEAAMNGLNNKVDIGQFEFQFAMGESGKSAPNDKVCYPKSLRFDYTADESMHQCLINLNVKGEIINASCELIAG